MAGAAPARCARRSVGPAFDRGATDEKQGPFISLKELAFAGGGGGGGGSSRMSSNVSGSTRGSRRRVSPRRAHSVMETAGGVTQTHVGMWPVHMLHARRQNHGQADGADDDGYAP